MNPLMNLPFRVVLAAHAALSGSSTTNKQEAADWLVRAGYQRQQVIDAANGMHPMPKNPPQPTPPSAQQRIAAQMDANRIKNLEDAAARLADSITAQGVTVTATRDALRSLQTKANATEAAATAQAQILGTIERRLDALGNTLNDRLQQVESTAQQAVQVDPAQVQAAIVDEVRAALGPIQAAAQAAGTQAQVQQAAACKVIDRRSALDLFGIDVRDTKGQPLLFDMYDHPNPPPVDPFFIWTETPIRLLHGAQTHGARVNLWLGGEKGTGKTQTLQQFAARTGRAFVRINFHKDTSADEYLGAPGLTQGSTHFADGPFIRGYETPGTVVCLDEITNCHPGELAPLNGLLEPGARQVVGDRARVRAPGVIVGACDNTLGAGDPSGRYHGTREMNVALMQRFAWRAPFSFLPRDVERKALHSITGADVRIVDHLLDAVDKCRAAVRTGEVIDAPSIRDCSAFLMALHLFPVPEAWAITIAAAQPVESTAALEGIYHSCINPAFIAQHL